MRLETFGSSPSIELLDSYEGILFFSYENIVTFPLLLNFFIISFAVE